MIKVKFHQILGARTVLNKILTHEFSGVRSFKISKILKAVESEVIDFNKARERLIFRYAETDEKGKIIINDGIAKIKEEYRSKFDEELKELLSIEVELPCDKIPVDWLEEIKITPKEIFTIEAFLE